MTSKKTSSIISENVDTEDLDALAVEFKSSLKKKFPCKRRRSSDFNVVYDVETGEKVTAASSRKRSQKSKRLPNIHQASGKYKLYNYLLCLYIQRKPGNFFVIVSVMVHA